MRHTLVFAAVLSARLAFSFELVRNGGFEEDWMNHRGDAGATCGSEHGDYWANGQDHFPDFWWCRQIMWPGWAGDRGTAEYPSPEVFWDRDVKHSGAGSLCFAGKGGDVRQTHALIDFYDGNTLDRKRGGSYRSMIRSDPKLSKDYLASIVRPLDISFFVKAEDVPDKAKAVFRLTYGSYAKQIPIPTGTYEWREMTASIPAQEIAAIVSKRGLARGIAVLIQYSAKSGKLWLDDVSVKEGYPAESNLMSNASFQEADEQGYPKGWSQQKRFNWFAPATYYIWNHWWHFYGKNRGAVLGDTFLARSGMRSLRMDVYPGDDKYVESPPILLNQKELRPLEVGCWVRAQDLKGGDIKVVDENGKHVNDVQFLGYRGSVMSGTHPWIYVRKHFIGNEPLKSVRVRLCARGFNGYMIDDVGMNVTYNQTGTVWFDDLHVCERGSSGSQLAARGVPTIPYDVMVARPVRVVDVDLGERLVGENELSVTVANAGASAATLRLDAEFTLRARAISASSRGVKIAPGSQAALVVPYELDAEDLTRHWRRQLSVALTLRRRKETLAATKLAFSTWPKPVCFEINKTYSTPDERSIVVAANIGVASRTLGKTDYLDLAIKRASTDKALISKRITEPSRVLSRPKLWPKEQDRYHWYKPNNGQLNMQNLLLVEVDVSELPVREVNDPTREYVAEITGYAKTGPFRRELFRDRSYPFGRMKRPTAEQEPVKTVSIDPESHMFVINGRPLFPMATSHGGRAIGWNATTLRDYFFNGGARWPNLGVVNRQWAEAKVYHPMLVSGIHRITPEAHQNLIDKLKENKLVVLSGEKGKPNEMSIDEFNSHPSALTYTLIWGEGHMYHENHEESVELAKRTIAELKKKVKRPISIMISHASGYPFDSGLVGLFDAIYSEQEPSGPLRLRSTLDRQLRGGKTWLTGYLPQEYEYLPWERERFQTYENIIRGSRLWWGIHSTGDPSLYRGLRGELLRLTPFLFSKDEPPAVSAEPTLSMLVKRKGNRALIMATNCQPVIGGAWEWNHAEKHRGAASHAGSSAHPSEPEPGGFRVHSIQDMQPIRVGRGDRLVQYVRLDPESPPDCIMLATGGSADWNHIAYWGRFDHAGFKAAGLDEYWAGELYFMNGYNINSGRPAEILRHRFPASAFRRAGDVPKPGEWVRLELDLAAQGIEGLLLDGIAFVEHGGKALWDHTVYVDAAGQERMLCEDTVGTPKDLLKSVRIKVPSVPDGTKVAVLFEDRELIVKGGEFVDNFEGVAAYDCFWQGWAGDGTTYGVMPERDQLPHYPALGYCYNNDPVCVHVYEIRLPAP